MGFRIQDPPLGIFIHKEPINMIKAHLLNFQTVGRGPRERGHISMVKMIKLTLFAYWEMIKLSSELVRKFPLLSSPTHFVRTHKVRGGRNKVGGEFFLKNQRI